MILTLSILLLVGFVVALSLAATPVLRARRSGLGAAEGAADGEIPETELALTIEDLARLDAEFRLGGVSKREYDEQRALLRLRAGQLVMAEDERLQRLEGAIEARVAGLKGGPRSPPPDGLFAPAENVTGAAGLAPAGRTAPPSRVRWTASAVALAVAFAGGVVWLVAAGRATPSQQAVAELALPDYAAIAAAGEPDQVLVLGFSGGLLASRDGGQTWETVGPKARMNALAATPEFVYAAGDGLFRATGLAREWEPIPIPGSQGELIALAGGPTGPDGLMAIDSGGSLWLSADGGRSWERLPVPAPGNVSAAAFMPSHGFFFLSTPDQGVLAGDGRSSWGGANGFVNGALPTVRVRSLIYDPTSGDSFEGVSGRFDGALYAGTDLGLFKSVDGGASWLKLPLDASVAGIAVTQVEPKVITVLDVRGRVFRSGDRGLTWDYGAR